MKFSIIIPVYNASKYLEQCLTSIVNQKINNFEVICINDGSTDNSLDILENFRKKYNFFKIITQNNMGQGIARNIGIKNAKGEYICFIDPDDYISPNYISSLTDFCSHNSPEVLQFNFKYIFEDNPDKIVYYNKSEIIENYSNIELNDKLFYNYKDLTKNNILHIMHNAWGGIYKKEFLEKNNIVFGKYRFLEDNIFCNKILIYAEKIFYIDKYIYYYRIRKDSNCHLEIMPYSLDIFDLVYDHIIFFKKGDAVKNNIISKEHIDNYIYNKIFTFYKNTPLYLRKQYKNKAKLYLSNDMYNKFLVDINEKQKIYDRIFSIKTTKYGYKNHITIKILWLNFFLDQKYIPQIFKKLYKIFK